MEKFLNFSLHIERIISISLKSFSIVNNLASVSVKNCPFPILNFKFTIESFSEAICVICTYLGTDLHKVITEDKFGIISGKKSSIVKFSGDFEIKWVLGKLKVNGGEVERKAKITKRVNRKHSFLWNCKPLFFSILDFDIKIIKWVNMECKDKIFNNSAGWFNIVFILTCVLQRNSNYRISSLDISSFIFGSGNCNC